MRSVADELRDEQRAREREMTPMERLELALRLGEEGVAAFMRSSGLSRREAIRELQRRKQRGRTPSGCMDALLR